MIVYNQSWVEEPTKSVMEQAGPLWNMWKTRRPPFKDLQNGDPILMIATKGPGKGMIMYESRTLYLVKEKYTSKNHAWKLLEASIPKKYLVDEDGNRLDKEYFMTRYYTMNAPKSGWLLSWLDKPVRWIGKPRPDTLILQRNGWGNIPDKVVKKISAVSKENIEETDPEIKKILQRTDIGPREKKTIINARRGQGKFRENVRAYENCCRVTGTSIGSHLIASHIIPWSESSDSEKIDGNNGLLLAPHIDHLFDAGLISFSDNGDLLISSRLSKSVIEEWGIPTSMNVGKFRTKQCDYLEYHRSKLFKK